MFSPAFAEAQARLRRPSGVVGWGLFDGGPEALKVLGRGLGQLVEFGEQLLGAGKLDPQPAGPQLDALGEALDAVGGLGAQGDLDGGGLAVAAPTRAGMASSTSSTTNPTGALGD